MVTFENGQYSVPASSCSGRACSSAPTGVGVDEQVIIVHLGIDGSGRSCPASRGPPGQPSDR